MEIERQIDLFKTGILFVKLVRPATVNDGILSFDQKDSEKYVELFKSIAKGKRVVKFIPSSGAASRMFKDLFAYLADSNYESSKMPDTVQRFIKNIKKMPFFDELDIEVKKRFPRISLSDSSPEIIKKYLSVLLFDDGMGYGNLPKALLLFHKYDGHDRMPFEEHIVEWCLLNKECNLDVNLHFTLSPQHLDLFKEMVNSRLSFYQSRFNCDININYSVQSESTDTIAVNESNVPVTDEEGNFIFRPGGHGALLYNLNLIEADIIFIKNIDNVAIESIEKENLRWKMLLGGVLIETKNRVHEILKNIESGKISKDDMASYCEYIHSFFNKGFTSHGLKLQDEIYNFLNRPIRVCGMVKNKGEPGGGPFWVSRGGEESLQIIESAQINKNDSGQKRIAMSATHFNPVDLVCYVKDHRGKKFNLNDYSDLETSFISSKTNQGKVLKALEHPGLWNGAMGFWLTIFVEVPVSTFNPVKTVVDLLKEEHQVSK